MAITDEASNIRTSMRSNSACAADPWGMPASSAAVLIALSSADWRENASILDVLPRFREIGI